MKGTRMYSGSELGWWGRFRWFLNEFWSWWISSENLPQFWRFCWLWDPFWTWFNLIFEISSWWSGAGDSNVLRERIWWFEDVPLIFKRILKLMNRVERVVRWNRGKSYWKWIKLIERSVVVISTFTRPPSANLIHFRWLIEFISNFTESWPVRIRVLDRNSLK